jgi:hypothetical protein
MTGAIRPGPPATAVDLSAARERQRLIATELPRVRSAAASWRNGLAGLLTALLGFGLIKGRSDVSELDTLWAAVVGCLLAAALTCGAVGALALMRAANGRPAVAHLDRLTTRSVAEHAEALAAAGSLRAGIGLTLACAALLVAAVGVTWYGPAGAGSLVEVTDDAGTHCGSLLQRTGGTLRLQTSAGPIEIDPSRPFTVRAVGACPSS